MTPTDPHPPPTIGRIVHYVGGAGDGRELGSIRPAIVMAAGPGHSIDLFVFADTPFPKHAVDLHAGEEPPSATGPGAPAHTMVVDETPGHPKVAYRLGTWHWPPRV